MPDPIHFSNLKLAAETFVGAVETSKRSIQLYASLIDPALFNMTQCVESLSDFARSSRTASLKILVEDHKLFAVRFPALLTLSQRLTDLIEIRSVPPDIRHGTECYMVCDQRSLWLIPNSERLTGFFDSDDQVNASQYGDKFLYYWERSKQPGELRRLSF